MRAFPTVKKHGLGEVGAVLEKPEARTAAFPGSRVSGVEAASRRTGSS